MAYRRLGKSPGLPYTWETQSESVMKDESHGSHSLDHQADPLRSDMSPAREPKPSTRSRLRHHRSTIMTGVQGAFSASASTVSLTATRLRNLGKGSHEPTSTEPTTHGVIAKRSYRDLARSTFFKSSVDVTKVENATTASENPTDVAEDNTVYSMTDFQGGSSWTSINPGCKYLELDLFHPHDPQSPEDSLDDGILQPRELAPLSCFRNLRSLKITGMLLSYQREIWQAVWLNPGLEDLELDMAIGPVLVSPAPSGWRWIEGDWKPTVSSDIGNTY
ncbi:hypothetical protein FQN54_003875 [Arachnomyces sp. PD_36]|nr:hypothetical protein FQN54_003875 [Arachnomyces sp. PD_36]